MMARKIHLLMWFFSKTHKARKKFLVVYSVMAKQALLKYTKVMANRY